MSMDSILTRRGFDRRSFWNIVYEWEDVLSEMTGIPMATEKKYLCGSIFSRFPGLFRLQWGNQKMFFYDMYANVFIERNRNIKNTVPCIIDFHVSKNELDKFERNYSNHQTICVSSLEAYDFLRENNCQLNIKHLPLTLSDKYCIIKESFFEKNYDMVLVGRQNPVLAQYWEKYKNEHKGLRYLVRKEINGKACFCDEQDVVIIPSDDRQSYFKALKMAKIVLYATPGIDGGEVRTKGLSQVTPRFLEAIAAGCHVLSRYRENSDTDFFALNEMTPNINSYEQFRLEFDRALETKVDMTQYANYLSKHYTSTIVDQFKQL